MPRNLPLLVLSLLMSAGASLGASQSIPFEYREGYIWVKVRAEGLREPLNYVLDSGAGSSVVSIKTAAKLNLRSSGSVKAQRVGSEERAQRIDGLRADVSGCMIPRKALVLDLSSVSADCHQQIDGLIGQDFIRGKIVQIDFKARQIHLLDAADANRCSVLELRMKDNALCVPVSVNGDAPRWTRLDTGCDTGLHWVQAGRDQSARSMVALGPDVLNHVETVYHKEPIFPSEAGLLGTAVLEKFLVTIDAVHGRLLLRKT